jgi:hypothetical protein
MYAYHTVTHMWREVVLGPQANPAPAAGAGADRIPRAYHSMGFDPLTGLMVLAGGQEASGLPRLTADSIAFKSVGI